MAMVSPDWGVTVRRRAPVPVGVVVNVPAEMGLDLLMAQAS